MSSWVSPPRPAEMTTGFQARNRSSSRGAQVPSFCCRRGRRSRNIPWSSSSSSTSRLVSSSYTSVISAPSISIVKLSVSMGTFLADHVRRDRYLFSHLPDDLWLRHEEARARDQRRQVEAAEQELVIG